VESAGPDQTIRSTSRLRITIRYRGEKRLLRPQFLVGVYDLANTGVFLLDTDASVGFPDTLPPEGAVTCLTGPINLTPGRCFLNLALQKGGAMADYVQYAAFFDVEAEDIHGSGKVPPRQWVLNVISQEWTSTE